MGTFFDSLRRSAARKAAAAALAAAATLPLINPAPAHAIVGGSWVAPGPQSNAVVRLRLDNLNCTGTLIDPMWVLTARHCVGAQGQYSELSVGPFVLGDSHHATDVFMNPNVDLALVRLDRPSSQAPAPLLTRHLVENDPGVIAGWGGYRQNLFLVAKQADARVFRRVTHVPGDEAALLIEAIISRGRLQSGDSGGPLFVDGHLAGVASNANGTDHGVVGSVGWYIPVAEHLQWISAVTGIPLPPAAGQPAFLHDAAVTGVPEPNLTFPAVGSSAIESLGNALSS